MMELLQALEASTFSMWVKESSTAYVAVLAFHTIGLAFLVGISGATAIRILGVAKTMPLQPMEDFFPLMYAGFWLNLATGTVLMCLYPTQYLIEPTIYIKLSAIIAAMLMLQKLRLVVFSKQFDNNAYERGLAKRLSITLLTTWLIATVAGRVMAYTMPTKIQTALAVVVVLGVVGCASYLAARNRGWIGSAQSDL